MTHDLKVPPAEFRVLTEGTQRCVVRRNQNFAIGDLLCLREFDGLRGGKYTGRNATASITHILPGDGTIVSPLYVIMSVGEPIEDK